MVTEPKQVFIYGQFVNKDQRTHPQRQALRFDNAIEILREFSATELVGKVYAQTAGGNLQAVSVLGLSNYGWYGDHQAFLREGGNPQKKMYFATQDEDFWEVLYFRPETDSSGAYVAVALQLEGSFWLRETEFRAHVIDPDKVVAIIPTDSEGVERTGMRVRLHSDDTARIVKEWLPTDRIFFYHFAHGRRMEIGYINDRTKERIPITDDVFRVTV